MAGMMRVIGAGQVLANMRKANARIRMQMAVRMKMAGLFLQRESQTICPVDTATLKNSAFTRAFRGGTGRMYVEVGYTAAYAIFVHEDLEATHAAGTRAKFLEEPMRTKRAEILDIMRRGVKV